MTRNRMLLGVIAATVAAAGCSGGEAKEAPKEEAAAPVVLSTDDVATARREAVGTGVVLTGTLDPYQVVEVRAQVSGLVRDLRVDRGVAVRVGQPLAAIEAEGIRSQAAGARAGVAAAESQVALARRQLESARTLHDAGAMSEIEFRGAEAQYGAAQAQLAAARAQAAGAAENARRTVITAPLSGEISDRKVSAGEAVSPGQALFTVVSTDVLELAGRVPVEYAGSVRPGQPVEFTLDSYPGRTFRGSVARIEPTADPATRQIGVYVRLPNPGRQLVGGLFATGRILTGGQQDAVVVPAAAVRGEGAGAHVMVVENGTVVKRAVTTGERDDERGVVQVTRGLNGGEQVIAAPGELSEGTKVQIAAAAPAAAPGSEGR